MLAPYKAEFIEFMVRAGVLSFGDFVTKSGRKTPFFVNTGRYGTGSDLLRLGRFYAQAIVDRLGEEFDVLFGPAYKGIPLVAATSIALFEQHQQNAGFVFNRKEAKDHGEGGLLIGQPLRDGSRVLIVEDVTTAGTSVRECVPLLRAAARVQIAGLVVSVDRMERGTGPLNALAELQLELGAPCFSIVTIEEVMSFLRGRQIDDREIVTDSIYERFLKYRSEYGGKTA
ncbi:MAG TPA: orotate phosphoribosyltransferase [Polyangiaceae bacterium]|nr:orotate phosphoribosyltransferase [Polyangiaceae bacterium]